MVPLTFYASGTSGRYGIHGPLTAGQTFGSWGAAVCVILLVKLPAGGIKDNETTIKDKARDLLDAAVGADNKGCVWAMTAGSKEDLNTWMKDAMMLWFEKEPTESAADRMDGCFDGVGAVFRLGNDVVDGTTEVNTGNFTVERT